MKFWENIQDLENEVFGKIKRMVQIPMDCNKHTLKPWWVGIIVLTFVFCGLYLYRQFSSIMKTCFFHKQKRLGLLPKLAKDTNWECITKCDDDKEDNKTHIFSEKYTFNSD